VLVALGSGLDSYDDRLLSAHMLQHMVLLLLAPLLLGLGRPALLTLMALSPARRAPLARRLARCRGLTSVPACLGMFWAVVLLTHLPGFYDAALRHPVLHDAEHASYLLAGGLLWWPLLSSDPLPSRRLGGLGMLLYLLVSMPPMALVGAVLNRQASLIYPAYAAPGQALGISAVADQAQAGAIMWVAGNTLMVAVGLWAAVGAMVREERRLSAREARLASTRGEGSL
jgi:cytochrome c oxidase assembly factor CtaG